MCVCQVFLLFLQINRRSVFSLYNKKRSKCQKKRSSSLKKRSRRSLLCCRQKEKKNKLTSRRQRRRDFASESGEEIINSLYIPDPAASISSLSLFSSLKGGREEEGRLTISSCWWWWWWRWRWLSASSTSTLIPVKHVLVVVSLLCYSPSAVVFQRV